jgi:hypothetical protein
VQVTLLKAKLINVSKDPGAQKAKVELNLAPRMMETESKGMLPSYQVSARLSCNGGAENDSGPKFMAQVGFEVIYQQVDGDPVDIARFTANHASLTRQLYPLLQQELRLLLVRLGLEQIHLPFDLATKINTSDDDLVQVSSLLH